MTERPKGMRFSHLYLERGKAVEDSEKARFRLTSFLAHKFGNNMNAVEFAGRVSPELGCPVAFSFDFTKLTTVEFLDTVTIVTKLLSSEYSFAPEWRSFVDRVFDEENLAYEVDDEGGVHYKVDREFTANLKSTLQGLSESRFRAATEYVASVQHSLNRGDARQAVRDVFDAAENIFKTILGKKASRLGSAEIKSVLAPRLQSHYAQGTAAQNASRMLLNSFEDWVVAAHYYRHVEGEAEPPPPPTEVSILLISNGLGFVRWLAAIEEHLQP
ncbi:MAG TPA: hypothetical protein VFX95_03415 [Caulobacteraceae bacterium]|nr:hypothetical protein [Caulobacteraceae bacterium]